jgi:hypothetical protein
MIAFFVCLNMLFRKKSREREIIVVISDEIFKECVTQANTFFDFVMGVVT